MTVTNKQSKTNTVVNPMFEVIGDAGFDAQKIFFSSASIKLALKEYWKITEENEQGEFSMAELRDFSMIELGYFDDGVWETLFAAYND